MTTTLDRTDPATSPAPRRVVHRTTGHTHGFITRLMSPGDLGQALKPFVFLDIFDFDVKARAASGMEMPIHPHSGIATVTVLTDGQMRFEDPSAGSGTLSYGGVEWMRAGGGVWHGKELSPAPDVPRVRGFQLWLALPPEFENAEPQSQYVEAAAMPRTGPAHVIVGNHAGVQSPLASPGGINYLLVTLRPGERWTYEPPAGHALAWVAVAQGRIEAADRVAAGEMVVFEAGQGTIALENTGADSAVFVLGSAVPHPHDLHLGNYSVHTSADALAKGERRIRELYQRLQAEGDRRTGAGTVPVYR